MGTRLSSKSQGLSWYQIWSTSHMKFVILFLCASPPYPRWWIANSLFLTLTCLEHYSWLSYQGFLSWLSSQINLCLLNLLLMFYYQTHLDCQLPTIYSSSLIHICNSLATFLLSVLILLPWPLQLAKNLHPAHILIQYCHLSLIPFSPYFKKDWFGIRYMPLMN